MWHLFFKFWKHKGTFILICVYAILIAPLPAVLAGKFINTMLYYWLPICLVAGLFCIPKMDPKARAARFRRIVFWGLLIVLSGMAAIQIFLRFHKVKVKSLEVEYSQTTVFKDGEGRFQVSAPSAWSEKPDLNEEADMTIGEETWDFYFQVLLEPKSDFLGTQIKSLDDYKNLILEMMITEHDMNTVPVTLDVELNEYNTIQTEMKGKIYGIVNIVYYLVFVEDTHNYYQLIGFMNDRKSNYDPERYDMKKEILQNVFNSFHSFQNAN